MSAESEFRRGSASVGAPFRAGIGGKMNFIVHGMLSKSVGHPCQRVDSAVESAK